MDDAIAITRADFSIFSSGFGISGARGSRNGTGCRHEPAINPYAQHLDTLCACLPGRFGAETGRCSFCRCATRLLLTSYNTAAVPCACGALNRKRAVVTGVPRTEFAVRYG